MQSPPFAHLFRRAGFGASPAELRRAEAEGWSATVDRLFRGLSHPGRDPLIAEAPQFQPFVSDVKGANPAHGPELLALTNWWLGLMASSMNPLQEKLVLLLHSQFPTAYYKVNVPSLLYRQNMLFREMGRGRFDDLMKAVARDPAMLIWLDTDSDLKSHPNENFSRELMERFAMGVGTYSEADVLAAARSFTGWSLDYQTGEFRVNTNQQDFGWKTVLGHSGALGGDEVIEIVTHTPASHHWVVSRLWSWLAYPVGVHHPVVAELAPGYGGDLHVGNLVRAIIDHPEFASVKAQQGLVKQPVEYVVGALRTFGLGPSSFPAGWVMNQLTAFGQQLFNPPTVGGWGANGYWLSTANSIEQLRFATAVATTADLSHVADEPARRRVEALSALLGVGTWSQTTAEALDHVRDDPVRLVSLALVSPEYLTN